jgi:hypothetical protein
MFEISRTGGKSMNERIRELAEQCTDRHFNEGGGFETFDKEKFAELIVEECIDLSLRSSHRDDDMGAIIANKIKEHFGVKK